MMEQRNFEVRFLEGKVKRLEREIAKLRELVRDMWRDRDALSYGAAIPTLERMRELGVEVDG